jgi:hypothetical protein
VRAPSPLSTTNPAVRIELPSCAKRVQLIVDELARHRHQFEAFCRLLSDAELEALVPESPWTVRDYIAHLATIDGLIAPSFAVAAGVTDIPPSDIAAGTPFDIDDWNATAVEARAGRTVEEMLDEAAVNRANYVRAIEALSDAALDAEVQFGARRATGLPDVPVPLREVLWAIAVHDPNHTSDILRALPHRAEEPFVREWLASARHTDIHPDITARRS